MYSHFLGGKKITRSKHHLSNLYIVTDLDGTLLDNEQKISCRSRRTIEEFKRNGGIFTFATGRIQTSIVPFIDQLNIQQPIITHNGAQIYCPVTKRVIYRQSIAMNDYIVDMLTKLKNVEIMYFINEKIYTNKKGALIELFEKKEGLTVLEDVSSLKNQNVTKIIIAHPNQNLLTTVEQQIKNEFPSLYTTYSEPEYLELLQSNTSKGSALKYMKKHYIAPEKQVITFGNNINDIPLIDEADIGVAVKNAHPELKRISTIILQKTNQEDALADYLEKL